MLQCLARLIRPAPPVEVATPARRPLYEGLTTREYLEVIRARNIAREAEELEIRLEMVRVERERARIKAMKADNNERETIRSSRWITTDTKGK